MLVVQLAVHLALSLCLLIVQSPHLHIGT